jgi:putative membrane protein
MSNIEKAVSLTKYFVNLPKTSYLLSFIFLLSLFLGLGISLIASAPLPEAILTAIFILAVPGFLTIIIGKILMARVPARRIAATALAGAAIYSLTYLLALSFQVFSTPGSANIIFIGSALVFIIWYIIARIVFVHKWRSLVFAILQLFVHVVFLITDGLLPVGPDPFSVLAKFYLSAFVLLAGLYIFFLLVNAPMKRTFGVASTEAVSMFFSQWFYDKNDIEKAFRRVGETVTTYLSVLLFRRKDGDYAFIVPAVHFGPFGSLGGSNFSHLIAGELEKKHKIRSLVFHGPSTHDLNPVSSTELKKITEGCSEILSSAKPAPSTVSLSCAATENALAESLNFKGHSFIGLTRAPKTTEDISLGMGMALMATAEKTVPSATIVDQHNAETGEIEYVEPGTKMGFQYLEALEAALSRERKEGPLRAGFAFGTSDSQKIGPAGIKVAVLSTEPEYVIILPDANGITPAFRRRIMASVESLYRTSGWGEAIPAVYTTDTHSVNTVRGVVNPLTEDEATLAQIGFLVKHAHEDMQDAQFFAEKRKIDIRVLGAKQAIEIISTVNSIVAISKVAAPIIIFSGIIAILWIIHNLG